MEPGLGTGMQSLRSRRANGMLEKMGGSSWGVSGRSKRATRVLMSLGRSESARVGEYRELCAPLKRSCREDGAIGAKSGLSSG